MKPEEIGYLTDLDQDYAKELAAISLGDYKAFAGFIDRWSYWFDKETLALAATDWSWLGPLVANCRKGGFVPTDRHAPALALAMPAKIFKVSLVAAQFKVPWGCAYKRLRESGQIDY